MTNTETPVHTHRPEYQENRHSEKFTCATSQQQDELIKEGRCYINLKNPEQCPQCSNNQARYVNRSNCTLLTFQNHAIRQALIFFCDTCKSEYMVVIAHQLKPGDKDYCCPHCGGKEMTFHGTHGTGFHTEWIEGKGMVVIRNDSFTEYSCNKCSRTFTEDHKGGPLT